MTESFAIYPSLRDRPVFVAVSSGGRYSGEQARQPDFLTPYLKAVLGIIGLHDLTFFSVQGSGLSDAAAKARARTDRALQQHFSCFHPLSRALTFASDGPAASPNQFKGEHHDNRQGGSGADQSRAL